MEQLQIITYKDNRVLTTKQIADSYETTQKVISNNFNNNKERYQEGKHYFMLVGDELYRFLHSLNLGTQTSKIRAMYIWTEKGAFLHAKSLNTDKAWELYDQLVDDYFRKQKPLSLSEQAHLALALSNEVAEKLVEVDEDLQSFKKDIPLFPVECDDIQKEVRSIGTKILGGHGSPAYKDNSLRGRVYADIGHEIKHKFSVHQYKAIKRKYIDEVKTILSCYTCPVELKEEIEKINQGDMA